MDDVQFFVQFVIQSLARFPESVRVEKIIDERGTLLSVTLDPSDMGRVIGQQGSTVHAVRHLMHCLEKEHGIKYSLKITDPRSSSNA